MDPGLLAVASSGSWAKLQSFLNGTVQQHLRDEEALHRVSFLDAVTIEGDTFLHVMATNCVGEDLMEDGIGLIRSKAVQLLFERNKKGDTALHYAARADKPRMVNFLLHLAPIVLSNSGQFCVGNDATRANTLLKTENNSRWTVLHEAVCTGNIDIVNLLMRDHSELASFPNDGISPLYLAILLERKAIAEILHENIGGLLSYSGPNGQNALHAAVLRSKDLTRMLLGWNNALTMQQDENGSTPLHFAASVPYKRDRRPIHLFLLEANPNALYQPDHEGSFPIHVAASVSLAAVSDFIKNSPECAGLRDARGRTFLHVAAEKMQRWAVYRACRNRSLSWILNMQDNDGNTALHVAVHLNSLVMFCALFGNTQVHLNLTNGKGETPLDIARINLGRRGLYIKNNQNSEVKICYALIIANAKRGICRHDYYEKNDILQERQDEKRQMELVKESTQNQYIGSALIATVTFGATFAMPGGYRADDHSNGGTPTRAGRYDFEAFTLANALAFTFSAIAATALMASGSPSRNTRVRVMHYQVAYYCMSIGIKCLVAAFALGTHTMLAPVAHRTVVVICVLSSLVVLYQNLEVIFKHVVLIPPFCVRKGKVYTLGRSVRFIVENILGEYWPIIFIFCATIRKYPAGKVEPPVQPPTMSP